MERAGTLVRASRPAMERKGRRLKRSGALEEGLLAHLQLSRALPFALSTLSKGSEAVHLARSQHAKSSRALLQAGSPDLLLPEALLVRCSKAVKDRSDPSARCIADQLYNPLQLVRLVDVVHQVQTTSTSYSSKTGSWETRVKRSVCA